MRRRFLQATAGLACFIAAGAWAQTSRHGGSTRGLTVAQVIDTSAGQQDVSRDFLIGARAAWQDINARGGVRGRAAQHQVLEVDASPASLRAALDAVRDNLGCVALSGSAGDLVATQLVLQLQQQRLEIAHAAPWLQNSSLQADAQTFAIFA
ncbi:MAG TPA: twin-arginine translocation pathway signal protein, partial [Burkholderiaceae bacterium]|nr:twin-arginine translocation pathway signal protein [Burkholderiaceae bacterium]